MSELITSVTPQSLTELLQEAGYRVNQTEQNGIVQLLSASQGIGFAVRFGNPAAEQGAYVDFTYSCALRLFHAGGAQSEYQGDAVAQAPGAA